MNEVIVIDPKFRTAEIPGKKLILGVEYEKDVETVRFKSPKFVRDGIDLSEYTITVIYENAYKDTGVSACQNVTFNETDVTFEWIVPEKAVMYEGVINFIVCAKKTDASGKVLKRFSTTLITGYSLHGLDATLELPENVTEEDIVGKLIAMVEEEGTKQKKILDDAVAGIVAEREQIQENKENKISKLNIVSKTIMKNGTALGGNIEKFEDGKYTFTSNSEYGRYDIKIYRENITDSMVGFFKVKVEETSAFPFNANALAYFYDSNGKNLGSMGTGAWETIVEKGNAFLMFPFYHILSTFPTVKRMDLGLMLNKSGAIISFYTYNLIDLQYVEPIMDQGRLIIPIEKLFDNKGFFKEPFYSTISARSESCFNAEYSAVEDFKSYDLSRIKGVTPHNSESVINRIDGNKITFTVTSKYNDGGIDFDVTQSLRMKYYHRYVIVFQSSHSIPKASIYKQSFKGTDDFEVKMISTEKGLYYYAEFVPQPNAELAYVILRGAKNESIVTLNLLAMEEIPSDCPSAEDYVLSRLIKEKYNLTSSLYKLFHKENAEKVNATNSWKNKNVLFIGDSLTAAFKYQETVKEKLGINIFNHCKGGVSLRQMVDGDKGLGGDYDNETDASGVLKPLSVNDVKDKELIVFYGGYNDRGTPEGKVGDCFQSGVGGDTIAGRMQYCINRIYEELKKANNLNCKILIVTLDCAGKYSYINADGYENYSYSAENQSSMETIANVQKNVAQKNSIPCLDLWHNSGINRNTWSIFANSPTAYNNQYSPYKLDSSGNKVGENEIKYVKGQSYYQKRNGQVVLEKYEGTAPYPYYADQLHKSAAGYKRIGECIAGALINYFGT